MSTQPTFHMFPKLPPEIRLMIWRMCLPHRVMEHDQLIPELSWEDDEIPCTMNWKITTTNAAPPLITRVCSESRTLAFKNGCPRVFPDHDPERIDIGYFGKYMIKSPWLDTARDSVHTSFESLADVEWEHNYWGDPVRCVMWHAARTRSAKASIVLGLLQTFQIDGFDKPDPHYRWTRSELADLMRTCPSWTVVLQPPVIVHADTEAAAGPFGLLADARVQIVDAEDQVGINEFMELGEKPNVSIESAFKQEDLVNGKEELRKSIKMGFGSEDRAPELRLAVVFRLCTAVSCRSAK